MSRKKVIIKEDKTYYTSHYDDRYDDIFDHPMHSQTAAALDAIYDAHQKNNFKGVEFHIAQGDTEPHAVTVSKDSNLHNHAAAKHLKNLMSEEREAAATLAPGAGSSGAGDPVSRVDMMAQVVNQIGAMSDDDLNKLRETLAQVGQEAASVPDGAAASNVTTIMAKGSAASDAVSEEISSIFASEDGEVLSEEFQMKAQTLFESAVALKANVVIAEEQERLEQEFHIAAQEYEATMAENLDSYLDYVAEQYFQENQLVIEQSIQQDLMESFYEGLKGLFAEHYIEVPEEKYDLLGHMETQIAQLEEEKNQLLQEAIDNKSRIEGAIKEDIIYRAGADLTSNDASKLRTLIEGVDFADPEIYESKVALIKEHYFAPKSAGEPSELLIEDSPAVPLSEVMEDDSSVATTPMSGYVSAISRTSSK